MKSMREHDGANYTKESEALEKYLMGIIHRYFLADAEYNDLQVESLIVESVRRVKQYLAEKKSQVFVINGRNGLVHINARSLGAEPKFTKKTAFNKDFGTEEDTICEGNDPRLSDAREPLYHTHYIDEFDGLDDMLYEREAQIKRQFPHKHDNSQTLDVIDYTGPNERFDLITIENCITAINLYLERIESIEDEYISFITMYKNKLNDTVNNINRISEDILAAKNTEQEWYNRALKHEDENKKNINDFWEGKKLGLITNEEMSHMKEAIENLRKIVLGDISFNPVEHDQIVLWHEDFNISNLSPEELFITNNELE